MKKIITPRNEEFQFSYTTSELIKKIRGPRLTHEMNYGPNEKMTQIQTNKKDTETVIFSETYEYNKDEQIIKATNNDSTYTYTKEGFLQSVTRGSDTIGYTYDLSGNMLKSEDQSGKLISENKYLQGNRIDTSIQYDKETNTYRHISYDFRENGSLAKETIRKPSSTSSSAKQTAFDVVKEYHYSSFNLLMSITTKQGSKVTERIEYTYDSEDNRSSKKVTNAEGDRFEFYYYDSNGDLVSVSRKTGDDLLENTMNFYRDASGKLLNFEYKGTTFDYVFNQRGDVVAITNEIQEVIARYSYDEWGNLIALEGLTPLGQEVAEENPYRYVGHYGVQSFLETVVAVKRYVGLEGRCESARGLELTQVVHLHFQGTSKDLNES
ncbi:MULTISPECIES: hypothetical protein [unclassified Exiguobacterium]|uniref:RHS repeat domain-containing protein n=1 Tax=unclassified Exiguobacterium TaxID=2644629 RepID=UPI001BE5F170|nr:MULTISPECIES: hypothetical protein [unclassified Exiguobacterium]